MSVNFLIPGDIKQKYLPFVLNPTSFAGENKNGSENKSNENAISYKNKIQLFSFKQAKKQACASCTINIVPESYKRIFNEDIANQLLYSKNGQKITFNDILENIPVIEIREFLPDTKLEQFLNIFADLIKHITKKIKDFFNKDKNDAAGYNKDDSSGFDISKIMDSAEEIGDQLSAIKDASFNYISPSDISSTNQTNLFLKNGTSRFDDEKINPVRDDFNLYYSSNSSNKLERILMHDFPKFMYYKLQSVTNSNIYVIPNNLNDKLLYSSDGNKGWSEGGMALTQAVEKGIPLIGGLVSKLLSGPLGIFKNLRIMYMPYWEADKGMDAHPEVKIEFELINDTVESAINNFLFVNTLIPNNKVVSYGLYQHSPCLYDVKIGGYDRLFACSGKFDVKHKGILRVPSDDFFNRLDKFINAIIVVDKNKFLEGLKANDLIRIPDTYEVSMSFTSLLPATFNNYMFTYSTNTSILDNIDKLKDHTPGPVAEILKEAVTDISSVLSTETNITSNTKNTEATKAENIKAQPDITSAGE